MIPMLILKGDDFFKDFVVFVLYSFLVWGSFPFYLLHFGAKNLLHFGAKIFDLHAVCCILDLTSAILNAICSISELKPQI